MQYNFRSRSRWKIGALLIGLFTFSIVVQNRPVDASSPADIALMKKVSESIVGKLISGDYEGIRENFDDNMKANLPASKIKEVWEGVKANIGEYKSHGTPYHQQVQGGNGIRIRCQMERGAVNVDVYFNSAEKVAGLWVLP